MSLGQREKVSRSNCCLEEYFIDELCFCQKRCSVRCILSELHCLVTIFDGQAILSSDYFTHSMLSMLSGDSS